MRSSAISRRRNDPRPRGDDVTIWRRSRERGNPVSFDESRWIPACAGMTPNTIALAMVDVGRGRRASASVRVARLGQRRRGSFLDDRLDLRAAGEQRVGGRHDEQREQRAEATCRRRSPSRSACATRRRRRCASASGSAPSTIAPVVIRIGRRRSVAASTTASSSASPLRAQLVGELDDQDAVLGDEARPA